MRLADYYLDDPRLTLIPIEHLGPGGMSADFAALLAARRGWTPARLALFDAGFALYWKRGTDLARRTPTWLPPRLRHVAVAGEPYAIRPYVQLLNTTAWLLYDADVDPERSHPEFLAYLLAHGDRMAASVEVTLAAVHTAGWWLERTDDERDAFATAAARASRPDAAAFRALAEALPWLRALRHETLRPPTTADRHRAIPGTGLLVPAEHEAAPPALAARWTAVARAAVEAYRTAWRRTDAAAVDALADWLAADAPPLVVTAAGQRVVWDPDAPARIDALRAELVHADASAVGAIRDDLATVARHTRAFHAALVDPAGLPPPAANTEHRGYAYLHRERQLIAYNLQEPGMERLYGTPLPYARHMLGARTAHEWAHLADGAGWVPRIVARDAFTARRTELAERLDGTIAAAPAPVRELTGADVAALAGRESAGRALTRILLSRMPDYRANLVARRFTSAAERETYVRQNVRTLRSEYAPSQLWRMLARYLYEYQYLGAALGFTSLPDPRTFFVASTWFDVDFLATGILDDARFDVLAAAVAALCASYAVDESRFR